MLLVVTAVLHSRGAFKKTLYHDGICHPHRIFTQDTDFSTRLAFTLFIETLQVCCLSNGALLGTLLVVT